MWRREAKSLSVKCFYCGCCYHVSQVAERALFLWNSEALINGGVLLKDFTSAVLSACRVRTIAGGVSLSLCDASVHKIIHVECTLLLGYA